MQTLDHGLDWLCIRSNIFFLYALLYLLFPFHPAFIIIILVRAGLSPAPRHMGFERIKTKEDKGFDADTYAHYLNHKYFECNYTDGIIPLDRWFETFNDGSEEEQERLRYRLKENYQENQSVILFRIYFYFAVRL